MRSGHARRMYSRDTHTAADAMFAMSRLFGWTGTRWRQAMSISRWGGGGHRELVSVGWRLSHRSCHWKPVFGGAVQRMRVAAALSVGYAEQRPRARHAFQFLVASIDEADS